MTVSFSIGDIPPSNNQFIGRDVRWKYQSAKKDWHRKITAVVGKIPDEPFEMANVNICYTFPDRRRRDPDNYAGKMILDPLVKIGVIADDDFNHINLSINGRYEKGVRKTEVTITEIKANEVQ